MQSRPNNRVMNESWLRPQLNAGHETPQRPHRDLTSIQALRGLAAVVVVLFHVCVLSVDYAESTLFNPGLVVGNAGVDLFFVISGFVMSYTTWMRVGEPGLPTRFAISRLTRIYPPYWVLTVLVFLYWLYNPSGVNSKHGGVDIWSSFLLLPSDKLPLIPVAWTLVYEVFFYAVFWMILCFASRRAFPGILAIWAALVIGHAVITGGEAPSNGLERLFFSPFNLEFISGAFVGMVFLQRGLARLKFASWIGVLIFLCEAVYFYRVDQENWFPGPLRVALFLVPSVLLLCGMLAHEGSRSRLFRAMAWVGGWSYSLYLTHILLIHLIYRVLSRRLDIEWRVMSSGFLFAGLVAVCLAVGYGYYRIVERPSASTSKFLLSMLLPWSRTAASRT